MPTLYGRSDITNITVGDHTHIFRDDNHDACKNTDKRDSDGKNACDRGDCKGTYEERMPVAGYGIKDRSVPILNCAECTEWAKCDAWVGHPDNVQKTADEVEYEDRSQSSGNMYMREMSEAWGRTMAQQMIEQGRTADATPARK